MLSAKKEISDFVEVVKSRNSLVLFVGAGINAEIIPLWSDLLNLLLRFCAKNLPDFILLDQNEKNKVLEQLKGLNNYERASIVKHYLNQEYLPALHEILYSRYEQDNFINVAKTKYPFLYETARLSQNSIIEAVVTYNYDEILSRLIKKLGRDTSNVFGIKSNLRNNLNTLPFYHIHGFVPFDQRIPHESDSRIVLSQDEYFNIMTNDNSWQTVTQLNYLMNSPCLFIGCSLTDWNMLRILALATKGKKEVTVFAVLRNNYATSCNPEVSKTLNSVRNSILKKYGVNVISGGNTHRDLPVTLSEINKKLGCGKY